MMCLNCGNEFEAKRKTARYCSSKCRVYASRSVTVKLPEETKVKTYNISVKWSGPVTKSFSARKKHAK